MVYPFEQIFAADPSSPERVASNGSVLIFAPGDTTKTPLTINALSTGLPLPNPITVNNDGFGPAFTHDSLDQVAWEGGGFSGLLTSYKGMKDEAVAARIAAEEAAAEAKKPVDQAVDDGIARADFPSIAARALAEQTTVINAAAAATKDAANNLGAVLAGDPRALRNVDADQYAIPFTDQEGYVAGGVQTDGKWNFEKTPRIEGAESVFLRPVSSGRSGWAIPFADKDGFVAGGIRPDGTAEFMKLRIGTAESVAIADRAIGYTRSSSERIACIGDSMTAGYFPGTTVNWTQSAYPAVLGTLVPSTVKVFNRGVSGYTVDEEAVRIGALPLPLTVAGGSIPESGSVSVTTDAAIGWRPKGTERNMKGSLAGIEGTLNRKDSDTAFTFTRTSPGEARLVPTGTNFVPDFAGHDSDTAIIMLGRNSIPGVSGRDGRPEDNVVNGIKRIVDWLTPELKQVLILSTLTNTLEKRGTAGYASVQEINGRLAMMYPSKFLDIRSYLSHEAIYELGWAPSPEDVANIEADTLPPSLMLDSTHYKPEVAALVAAKVFDYLTTRGWI